MKNPHTHIQNHERWKKPNFVYFCGQNGKCRGSFTLINKTNSCISIKWFVDVQLYMCVFFRNKLICQNYLNYRQMSKKSISSNASAFYIHFGIWSTNLFLTSVVNFTAPIKEWIAFAFNNEMTNRKLTWNLQQQQMETVDPPRLQMQPNYWFKNK